MIKRFLYLAGLSIFCVVIFHAAGMSFVAMTFWAERYLPPPVPATSQIGGIQYYILRFFEQAAGFAILVFLFISGFLHRDRDQPRSKDGQLEGDRWSLEDLDHPLPDLVSGHYFFIDFTRSFLQLASSSGLHPPGTIQSRHVLRAAPGTVLPALTAPGPSRQKPLEGFTNGRWDFTNTGHSSRDTFGHWVFLRLPGWKYLPESRAGCSWLKSFGFLLGSSLASILAACERD